MSPAASVSLAAVQPAAAAGLVSTTVTLAAAAAAVTVMVGGLMKTLQLARLGVSRTVGVALLV